MGKEFVYCHKCGFLIREKEFARGLGRGDNRLSHVVLPGIPEREPPLLDAPRVPARSLLHRPAPLPLGATSARAAGPSPPRRCR